MDLQLKKVKESNMLQHLAELLLISNIPAAYIASDETNNEELVHAIYEKGENVPKMISNYYFVKDDNYKDHIFVCTKTVIEDVLSLNETLDEDKILEILEAYNYLTSDGTFVLDGNDIQYRLVTIIDDDIDNKEVDKQLINFISTENAITEEVSKAFIKSVKGE